MSLVEKGKKYLQDNPARNRVFMTHDGNAFWEEAYARSHTQNLPTNDILIVDRSEEKAEEPAKPKKKTTPKKAKE